MSTTFDYHSLSLCKKSCPICDGDDFEILSTNDRFDHGIFTSGCLKCGLVFSNPQPNEDDLSNFYKNNYRQYYQKQDKPSLDYIKIYKKDQRARNTVNYLARHIIIDTETRVLDIGASEGEILYQIKQHSGTNALFAVEPNPEFGAFSADYTGCLHVTNMDSLPVDQKYDLVILNHVFEHLGEPIIYLAKISEILAENGNIYIDVPDISEYKSLESLHIAHVSHFSRNTLINTLAKAGFEAVDIERHLPVMHPRSIRGLFRPTSEHIARAEHDWSSDWKRVRRLQRLASRYHRKTWPLSKRIWSYLLSHLTLGRFSVARDPR